MSTIAYIGLGSNLADPHAQLESAIRALGALPGSRVLQVSSFYASDPLGPADQPRYVNAAAALETELTPLSLLDALQAIEHEQGRVRAERWGARTLDLDILLYGDLVIDEPRLKVPHYHMHARPFVLYPLAELVEPHFCLADGRPLTALLAACPFAGLERIG